MTPSEYQNPILCADYSDPDIVRVRDDFFMVSSSFNHVPALPILHSTDWLTGLLSTTFWMNCRYRVMTGISRVRAYGRHRFAGTMASCGSASAPQMKVFLSAIPRTRGEMERSALPASGQRVDRSCPFWDDNGQAWLVHAFAHSRSGIKHKLQLFAMAPDASELLGEGQIIYDGCCDLPTLEGQRFINAPVGTTSLLLRAG